MSLPPLPVDLSGLFLTDNPNTQPGLHQIPPLSFIGPANVAAFAAPRYPTRFIGCVGEDLGGLVLTQELEQRGVEPISWF